MTGGEIRIESEKSCSMYRLTFEHVNLRREKEEERGKMREEGRLGWGSEGRRVREMPGREG